MQMLDFILLATIATQDPMHLGGCAARQVGVADWPGECPLMRIAYELRVRSHVAQPRLESGQGPRVCRAHTLCLRINSVKAQKYISNTSEYLRSEPKWSKAERSSRSDQVLGRASSLLASATAERHLSLTHCAWPRNSKMSGYTAANIQTTPVKDLQCSNEEIVRSKISKKAL